VDNPLKTRIVWTPDDQIYVEKTARSLSEEIAAFLKPPSCGKDEQTIPINPTFYQSAVKIVNERLRFYDTQDIPSCQLTA
jgi:hypothetical protein